MGAEDADNTCRQDENQTWLPISPVSEQRGAELQT